MSDAARCMWMRGGTSKGGYFLRSDLPDDPAARDAMLLRIMGSPDLRQIDGMGGGHPLSSKVAIVSPSQRADVDVDYLFLQVFVDEAIVTDAQNCGNILAGVGPFAIERGLVAAQGEETSVAIYMENTGQVAVATVRTPGGQVAYQGDTVISGVPGSAAPISLAFRDTAGSTCGALLPTGRGCDNIGGVAATLIDNGMPCVMIAANDMGISGHEDREILDADLAFKRRVEAIRLIAGPMMNLGDVRDKSVPKMMLVAAPRAGGTIAVRSLIPHRVHDSIGVLGAVTVATACLVKGSPAARVAQLPGGRRLALAIEHPSGVTECTVRLDEAGRPVEAGMLRTARKLMDGEVFS